MNDHAPVEREHAKYQRLLDFCRALPPTLSAVAHPCDESSLAGAVDAARLGLIAPILGGPHARSKAVADQHAIDNTGLPIIDRSWPHPMLPGCPARHSMSTAASTSWPERAGRRVLRSCIVRAAGARQFKLRQAAKGART